MTPEEKFNQDVWWILQEIRTDELLTPKGENIEFNIRTQSKTISKAKNYPVAIPSNDVQIKLLYKLKDWKVIDVELVDNILQGSDVFHPRIHKLTIKRPKFDQLYQEYERIYNTDEQFFNSEKEKIQNIKVGTQHKIARDKWLNVKRILDAIYKLISPFDIEKKVDDKSTLSNILSKREVEIHNRNLGQKIFLDPNKLPQEQQQFFESTLRHLLDIEAVNYENYEDERMISSSEPIRNFLKGNILIKDRNKFEQYHNQIAEFVDFIQQDGKERFPELYDKHPKIEQIQPAEIEPNYPRPMIEITGEADRGIRWLDEKHHQTQLQRKQFKQDRILQTKKDKYIHAIDEIIERLESYDDGRKTISIDYHYFNFEDRVDDSKIFERFLDKLVRAGCLEKFGRSNYAGGTRFGFVGVNLGKLKKYREKIIKGKGINNINGGIAENSNTVLLNKLPLKIGSNESIHIKGKVDPILEKAPNRAYYFIRGCIEKSNDDLTVDIDSLYQYLKDHNDSYSGRYKIKDQYENNKWELIRKTYHNIKADYFDLTKYLELDKTTKEKILWITK